MKYSIVFSSRTGNTAQLAEALQTALPPEDCVYFGGPEEKALEAPLLFVGFWTDKGACDEATKLFLPTLKDKTLFLFGTAGFGGDATYFDRILASVRGNLDPSVRVAGSFMCQGKMPETVLTRYETMLSTAADPAPIQGMIANFHSAATHPDAEDLARFQQAVTGFHRQ